MQVGGTTLQGHKPEGPLGTAQAGNTEDEDRSAGKGDSFQAGKFEFFFSDLTLFTFDTHAL